VIPLLTFLLLAELGLRVYLRRHTLYNVEMSRYATEFKQRAENPRIGHVHRPGREGRLMNVAVRINADALRDDELPRERGEARRLVFLGDSLTFGWGVEKPQTFESLLERRLSEEVTPTEIVNFGTGNYNTTQQVQRFLETGLAYAPDAVVVFYFINDAEPVPRRSRWGWLGSSRLMTLYWSRIEALTARLSPASGFRQYYAGLYADDQAGWRETRGSLLELSEVCAERGIRLQVAILPDFHQLADYPFAREHATIRAFLAAHDIPVLDLAPRFADQKDPTSLWVAPDDAHPNARGHALIAQYSFDTLRGIVDEAR
jgi:lysophospholipase L1-like esterase